MTGKAEITETEEGNLVKYIIDNGRQDALASYSVNLTKDIWEQRYYCDERMKLISSDTSIDGMFKEFSDQLVFEDEKKSFVEVFCRGNLLKKYSEGRKIIYLSGLFNVGKKGKSVLVTAVTMYENKNTSEIEAYVHLYDGEYLYISQKIQERLVENEYESVGLINVSKSRFSVYNQMLYLPSEMRNVTEEYIDYEQHCRNSAEKFISAEEKEMFLVNSNLKKIRNELGSKDSYSFTVASINEKKENRYKKFTYYYLNDIQNIIVCSLEDVTDVLERDSLTGLYTRRGFVSRAEKLISSLKNDLSGNKRYAVIFIDIYNFKALNDIYGIEGGDLILRKTAEKLQNCFLKPILLSRSEADHFVGLVDMENIDYDKLSKLLNQKIVINNMESEIHGRCGIYEIENTDIKINRMCDRAMLANEHVNDSYVKPYAVYDNSMHEIYMEKAISLSSVSNAIKKDELKVFVQPIVDSKSGEIVSAEALVRWQHPELGFVTPGRFVPVLEKSGLISCVDKYVYTEIRKYIKRRLKENKKIVPISVNLTWMDFYDTSFINQIFKDIETESEYNQYIRFEVTETSYAGIVEENSSALDKLRSHGIKILVDDFGSGYSSFSTITDYNFDILKLDMGFVDKIGKNDKVCSVIHSIIDMAHHIDVLVTAEGVENENQIGFLTRHGCDYFQGFYYSKPICIGEFSKKLDA